MKPQRRPAVPLPDHSGDGATAQPGSPIGEARLLGVDTMGRTLVVTLEGGVRYEVDVGSVPEGLPAVGEVVPQAVVVALAGAQARKLAARDLMAMLDRRLQPEARLRIRLLDKGHPSEAVEAVLQAMRDRGLCSDRIYAEAYCWDTLRRKDVGARYLVARLRAHQVPSLTAREAVAAVLDPESEKQAALRAAAARWRRVREASTPAALAKVVRFLASRGFSPAVAGDAARMTRPDPDPEPEGDGK